MDPHSNDKLLETQRSAIARVIKQ